MAKFVTFGILAGLIAPPMQVPEKPVPLQFEVASIRKSPDPASVAVMTPVMAEIFPNGAWRATYATLTALLREVNPDLLASQIQGGKEWVRTDMFDIDARMPPGTSRAGARSMLQSLLADRFKLRVRHELREMPVYLLEPPRDGRLGSGLKPPTVDCETYRASEARGEPPVDRPPAAGPGEPQPCAIASMPLIDRTRTVEGANWRIIARAASLSQISGLLGASLGRPVLDRTGIAGQFDIEVQFDRRPLSTAGDSSGPQIRDAVRDQLGLRLTSGRAQVPVLIIESAELPLAD